MKKTLITVGIGAGLMYLLDPELGEIRRSMLKDKLRGRLPKTADALHDKKGAVATKAHELVTQADDKAAEAIEHAIPQLDEAVAHAVDAVEPNDAPAESNPT